MATRGGEGESNIKGVIFGETETDCTSVVQYDGMSFLDYKKKHQTLPDTSRNSHKYQEYQLRERGLQRDESFSVNDDCLEVINYKAEQRYEQQICIIYLYKAQTFL